MLKHGHMNSRVQKQSCCVRLKIICPGKPLLEIKHLLKIHLPVDSCMK